MSGRRAELMGKIQAVIDGHTFTIDNPDLLSEEDALDAAAGVQSSQEQLEEQRVLQAKIKTEADLQRLEEAKRRATSQAAKEKLEEEAELIKREKAKAEEEKKQEQEAITSAEQARTKIKAAIDDTKGRVDATVNRVGEVSRDAWDSLGNVARPGSIFLPVSLLLVFFFLLIPVNGHTRIEWLWLALTGQAHLTGESTGGSATGGSSDFGGPAGGSSDFGTPAVYVVSTSPTFTGPSEVM